MLFGWVGAGPLFLLNALSFVGLPGVYLAWWREGAGRVMSDRDRSYPDFEG